MEIFEKLSSINLEKLLLAPELYFAIIWAVLAYVVFLFARKAIPAIMIRAFAAKKPKWEVILREHKTFNQLAYLAPVLFMYFAAQHFPSIAQTVDHIISAYVIINITILAGHIIKSWELIYQLNPISKERPIKSYLQLLALIVYLLGGIFAICKLFHIDVTLFLSSIGALTAIIILVFKDTITSFIASLQLAANNLIQKGDWIEIPQYGANGDVVDVALHVIKVQNFDKTIVTVPTYKLMELGFKNWRGMYEAKGRRIKRALDIDQNSVKFLSESDLKRLFKHPIIGEVMPDEATFAPDDVIFKGKSPDKVLTNLSLFRRYVRLYLSAHPHISGDMTFIVRLLDPTPAGIPLEVYVFTTDTDWSVYEYIQSSIFEHLLAIIPEFGLRVFQYPADNSLFRVGEILQGVKEVAANK